MSALIALISALAYGASDFLAGLATRRASVFLVSLGAQSTAASATWLALPFFSGRLTSAAALAGVVAGAGAWMGTVFLYLGLARGRMSVVGPLSAVVSAAGSAVAGVAFGDRLSAAEIAGVVVACAAVGLVSAEPATFSNRRRLSPAAGLLEGALAGLGFMVLFVGLNRAGDGAGLWPVALSQATGLLLVGLVIGGLAARRRVRVSTAPAVAAGAVAAGLLGGGATIAYFVATHAGKLAVTAVLASLYPATTVVLALIVLRERLWWLQSTGLAFAAVAVALLAVRG